MRIDADEAHLQLKEGHLCLDFANTADWHASDHPKESLKTIDDLLQWAHRVGLLNDDELEQSKTAADRSPNEAQGTLSRAIALREAIYRLFSATATGAPPPQEDLEFLNQMLTQLVRSPRVVRTNGAYTWAWEGESDSLDRLLTPIALSAATLLTSEELDRVGECADDRGCGWLFFDTSRNKTRRWCSMEACGNRAKVLRHYHREHD